MKLRYASQFGNRAGTCWKLIFVYALKPWLHKYRILARPEQMTSQYFSRDLEKRFPSLRFVSLRNVHVLDDFNDEEGEFNAEKGPISSIPNASRENDTMGGKVVKDGDIPHVAHRVRFSSMVGERQMNPLSRILELEEENKRLKITLAKTTLLNQDESEC